MPSNEATEKGDKSTAEKPKSKDEKDKKAAVVELSEEDQMLKDGLELAVQRLQESNSSLHEQALNYLCNEIRTSTASMTSVPKPLKMLRPHYDALKQVYYSWHAAHDMKQVMADMLSVLAMTMSEAGSQECLKFKLEGTNVEISSWGHEYVRSLSGEISEEYNRRLVEGAETEPNMEDLMALVDDILPFQMQHNAEAEAVDLLLEVQQLVKLIETDVVDKRNYERVCLYLIRCADFMADPDDLGELFNTAYTLYETQGAYPDALRVALKMDDLEKVERLFSDALDISTICKQQMAFILARNRSSFECEDTDLNDLIGNAKLSEYFVSVGRDMDVMDAKTPEDIYKTHLAEGTVNPRSRNGAGGAAVVDSARANLASSFVNAFVNAGFGQDTLITPQDSQWVHKNKDHGMMSAAASLGMVMLWNIDGGLNELDKFLHNREDHILAGGCLAMGIVSSGVRSESDPALAVLSEYIENSSHIVKCGAICGLGMAYAGARREEVKEMLVPIVSCTEECNFTEVALAALSLGMVFVGTCDDEVAGTLIQRIMEASEDELNSTVSRFLCLGLGLLFLGKNERADAMLEAVRTVEHKMGKYADITLETCAYAGTGNVLMVQRMLHVCAEHGDESAHQAAAVIGIALMTVGEDVGTEMTLRTLDHLLHYGSLPVKRAVPLALALLYVSNPDYSVIDTLSRLSHDVDAQVAQSAIFSLGVVSAGSNNSRVAGLLRQLSEFYIKEADHLFIVRLAQGLNAMGKGLLTLTAFHSDRLLMNGPSMAGVLTILHACIDLKGTLLDKFHYMLYFLAPAMNPRFLVTLDENLEILPTTVRVGLAVETVGQAGRPRTITGFQTNTTPVLMGYKDRAELASKENKPVASVLEGFALVSKSEEEKQE